VSRYVSNICNNFYSESFKEHEKVRFELRVKQNQIRTNFSVSEQNHIPISTRNFGDE